VGSLRQRPPLVPSSRPPDQPAPSDLCAGVYSAALRLYPADYQARFAAEMRATFREALAAHRQAVRFTIAECGHVLLGAGREWLSKLTTDRVTRGRCLPDCRLMRPVGVTPQEWAGGLDWIENEHDLPSTERAEH
jgi:hypothetical protein